MNFISPNNLMAAMASLWVWALVISLLILLLYLIGTWNHDYFTKKNTPCLKTLPFLGNSGPIFFKEQSMAEYMLDIYTRLRGYKYGGVFQFMTPRLFLRDPKLIGLVTVKDFEYFVDRCSQFSGDLEPLIGKSLFHLKGKKWQDVRTAMSPNFASCNMKDMFILIKECAAQVVDFLKLCLKEKDMKIEKCRTEQGGNMLHVEMEDLFTRYASDVIATSAFGIKCNSFNDPCNEFYQTAKEITDFSKFKRRISVLYALCPRLVKILWIKLFPDRITNYFKSLVKNTMASHASEGIICRGIMPLLVQANKGKLKCEKNGGTNGIIIKPTWEEDDITAQVVLFLFAGFNKVSTLLSFASYHLAAHPEVQTRLQEEIDQNLKENNGKLKYEALQSMKYLDMVLSETLRLNPPTVFLDRKCIKKYTFPTKPPYTLNPGDGIWIPLCAIHRDPRYFPDPEKFDPERFNEENKDKIQSFTYMPFGAGPRNCIGSRFALMETKAVLIHLLSEFNLRIISKTALPIKTTKKSQNIPADDGFWLGLEKR